MNDSPVTPVSEQETQPQLVAPEDSSLRPPASPEPAEARTPAALPAAPVAVSPSPANTSTLPHAGEFLWKTHSYINEYIRFADAKAGFTVAIATALIGALFTARCHERFLYIAPVQWTGIGWLSFLSFAFLLASILAAVAAVRPRLWTTPSEGFIFWESVTAFKSPENFTGALLNQTPDSLAVQVAHHVYALSTVCRRKYLYVNAAIMLGVAGGILGGLTLLYLPKT